ncbi:uncharacterized protein F5891DRAFT_1225184 [Suillus fuscotomentosus]|uniref:Uncharacterized protein n=1 Tax=Suillus fuscotomentosus TaxID=1912939 RepID=A0AAD4E703_9AGAM|nr:uncharacterized protein F5891DRAFT_1225184 [Suillus fuscotomentosus]KAG1900740.1 hypothetical protein F5891DRAFT_1225184 [Suillus fuscotomentosus]
MQDILAQLYEDEQIACFLIDEAHVTQPGGIFAMLMQRPHELALALTPKANVSQLFNHARITHKYEFRSIEAWALDSKLPLDSFKSALDSSRPALDSSRLLLDPSRLAIYPSTAPRDSSTVPRDPLILLLDPSTMPRDSGSCDLACRVDRHYGGKNL